MNALTDRQAQVLDAMLEYLVEHQRLPSMRWLGARLAIQSTNGVWSHVAALVRKGFVLRDGSLYRVLRDSQGRDVRLAVIRGS